MAKNNTIVSAVVNMKLFLPPCIILIPPNFISYLSSMILHRISNINFSKIPLYNRNIENVTINNFNRKTTVLQKSVRINRFLNLIYFVSGFSLAIIAFGVFLNRVLINIYTNYQNTLQITVGIVIIPFRGLNKDLYNIKKFVIYEQRVYNLVKTNNMENKRAKLIFKENNFKSTHLHLINWSIL